MQETNHTGAAKLLALLEALSEVDSESREGLTVAELARAIGRDKSIVSRQLKPLVELGLVERDAEGRHSLGWRLFAVAAKAGDQRLLLLAPPVMRRLTQLVRERVHLSIRRGPEVFTILSESPQRSIEATGWVGRTAPINCTSAGRALLFDHSDDDIREIFISGFESGPGPNAPRSVDELIDRVASARRQGFALVVDEFDDELCAVAAPVRDVHGRIVAVLNISAPSYRLKDNLTGVGRSVCQAAQHLSRTLSLPPDVSTDKPKTDVVNR
ncbi:MAG: IclR family transcriptional regulator [Actinomycetota bacterium]|nr:IclR family transcriptional regulator [Actinomycetota bacterium]